MQFIKNTLWRHRYSTSSNFHSSVHLKVKPICVCLPFFPRVVDINLLLKLPRLFGERFSTRFWKLPAGICSVQKALDRTVDTKFHSKLANAFIYESGFMHGETALLKQAGNFPKLLAQSWITLLTKLSLFTAALWISFTGANGPQFTKQNPRCEVEKSMAVQVLLAKSWEANLWPTLAEDKKSKQNLEKLIFCLLLQEYEAGFLKSQHR